MPPLLVLLVKSKNKKHILYKSFIEHKPYELKVKVTWISDKDVSNGGKSNNLDMSINLIQCAQLSKRNIMKCICLLPLYL